MNQDFFEDGEYIIRQGWAGDAFYIINEGTVSYFSLYASMYVNCCCKGEGHTAAGWRKRSYQKKTRQRRLLWRKGFTWVCKV